MMSRTFNSTPIFNMLTMFYELYELCCANRHPPEEMASLIEPSRYIPVVEQCGRRQSVLPTTCYMPTANFNPYKAGRAKSPRI